jgi:hypothetical protein
MTKPDDGLLAIGAILFAASGVWASMVDSIIRDETDIQTRLMRDKPDKYKDKPTEAGNRAETIKLIQRIVFVVLWIAGLILSILAFFL